MGSSAGAKSVRGRHMAVAMRDNLGRIHLATGKHRMASPIHPLEDRVPFAWCSWRRVAAFTGQGRAGQLAIAGRLTVGSSLNGVMVSRVM